VANPFFIEITKGKETVYFVRAKSAVLNFVTGIPKEAENLYRITEIVKDSETYLIQNVETGMCLKNPGYGQTLLDKYECRDCRVST